MKPEAAPSAPKVEQKPPAVRSWSSLSPRLTRRRSRRTGRPSRNPSGPNRRPGPRGRPCIHPRRQRPNPRSSRPNRRSRSASRRRENAGVPDSRPALSERGRRRASPPRASISAARRIQLNRAHVPQYLPGRRLDDRLSTDRFPARHGSRCAIGRRGAQRRLCRGNQAAQPIPPDLWRGIVQRRLSADLHPRARVRQAARQRANSRAKCSRCSSCPR